MEKISIITIPLDEYKELLVTKGKYESLKEQNNINYDEIKSEYIPKNSIIEYFNKKINYSNKLKNKYSEDSECFRFINYTNLIFNNVIDKIKEGKIK